LISVEERALLHREYLTNRTGRFTSKQETRQTLTDDLFEEWRLLAAANDIADQAVADYLGINRTDARCLEIIERLGGVTAGRLARESGLSTGAVTTVLDRLERSGLARRTSDPEDRRRVVVEMTPVARRANEELSRPFVAAAVEQMLGYSEEELALLREYHRASRALTEAHAERVRGLPRGRGYEGEAASS
jgi:DNA-binding MarR family transcriptional regulator